MLRQLLLISIFYIALHSCKDSSVREYEKNSEPMHYNVKVRNSIPKRLRDREPSQAIGTTSMRCSDHQHRLLTIPEIATLIKNPGHLNFSELAHHLPLSKPQFPVPPVPLPHFTFSKSNESPGIPPPPFISDILSNQKLPFSSIFNSSSLSRPFSQSNPSGTLGKGFGRVVSEISSLISSGSSGPFGSGGILSRNGSGIGRNTGLGIGNTLLHSLVGNGLTSNGGFGQAGNGNGKITISGTVFANNTPGSGVKFNKTIVGNAGGSGSEYEGAWQLQVHPNNTSVLISQIPRLGEALDNFINNNSTGINSIGHGSLSAEDSGGSTFGINNTPLSLEVGSDGSVAVSLQDSSNANENVGYDTEAKNGVLHESRHMQSPSHTKHVLINNKNRSNRSKDRSRLQHKMATKTIKKNNSISENNPGKKNKNNDST